jgi:hypothetical protein
LTTLFRFPNDQLQLMPPWFKPIQLKVLQSKLFWNFISGDEEKLIVLLLNRNRHLVFLLMQQAESEASSGVEKYEYMGNCMTPAEDVT